MFQSNKWKVLEVFFHDPEPDYQVSEISRKVKIARKSVKRYLQELEREGFLTSTRHRTRRQRLYQGNTAAEKYRWYKKLHLLASIYESGLIPSVTEQCSPNCILLFGSAAKGEDDRESDVDLFIQARERVLDVKKFEQQLKRTISLFFAPDPPRLSQELRNNLINGIVLYGYFKVL